MADQVQAPAQPTAADLNAFKKDQANFETDHAEHYQNSEIQEARDYFSGVDAAQPEKTAAPSPALQEMADKPANNPVSKVGKDVTLGMMQAPRSVARGAIKGVNGMISFIDGITDFLPTVTNLTEEGKRSIVPRVVQGGTFDARLNKERAADGKQPLPDAPQLPLPDKPAVDTVTGGAIEAITQFGMGFKGADKIGKGINALREVGPAAEAVATKGKALIEAGKNIVKGTAGDLLAFNEHEQRLSNVIQQVPALQNPVTQYLQAKPDDGFFEGKLKQAIEGAGLSTAGEVLFNGIRLLKQGKAAVSDARMNGVADEDISKMAAKAQTGEAFQKEALNTLGDVDNPDLLYRPKAPEPQPGMQAVDKLRGAADKTAKVKPGEVIDAAKTPKNLEQPLQVNFARIEGPEDIPRAMQELANHPDLAASVQTARRGVVSDTSLLKNADDVDGFSTLMERRTGGALNDAQTIAARKMYYDATDRLIESAKKAAMTSASTYDQYVFRRMMAIHSAVQNEVLGARAEAGRALRAWSIPVGGGNLDRLRAVEDALDNFGGAEATQDLAKRLAVMSQDGTKLTTSQINQITQGGALARTGKALQEVWAMGLLTSPRTHIVNVGSNVLTGLSLGVERAIAALGKDSPVGMREALEYFNGYVGSFRQALSNGAEAFKTGQAGFGINKIEAPFQRATSREVLDPEGKAGVFSKAIDWYGAALNKVVGGSLAAGDEFGKTMAYNAQLRALGARQAQNLGLEGADVAKHIAGVVSNPPPLIRQEAMDFAKYATYNQTLTDGAAGMQKAISKIPGARFVVPFVRTPMNIFKYTFERTPLGLLSQSIREDLSAGGARRAMASSKLGMGTSVMMLGTDMALNGEITGGGPVDPEIRGRLMSAGWKPYSIKIDGKYYSYSRFEPFATWLGMSADMAEITSNYEAYDMDAQNEVDELATAVVASLANQVVGKTFLSGVADMTQVLSDSKRYGQQYLNKYAGSLVPNGVADIAKAIDPVRHQVFTMMDSIKSRIPGLSKTVPVRYNVYGEPIKNYYPDNNSVAESFGKRAEQIFNPVQHSDKDAPSQKLDQWFLTSGISGPDMPAKIQKFEIPGDFTGGRVAVDLHDFPEIYARMVQKRAEVTLPQYDNKPMKKYLIDLVNHQEPYSQVFFMGIAKNRDAQEKYISNVTADYDKVIRKQLLDEFPTLRQTISEERAKQQVLQGNRGGEGLLRTKPFP